MMAFLATDILHPRCLSVLGTSCAIWFNYTRAPPWHAVWWGLCFVSINLCQIGLLLQEAGTAERGASVGSVRARRLHAWERLRLRSRRLHTCECARLARG